MGGTKGYRELQRGARPMSQQHFPDHYTRRNLHQQAWNDYGKLADEYKNLEQEADQEHERGGVVA